MEHGQAEPGTNNVTNYRNTLPESSVPLFTTIRTSTDKPNDSQSVALEEGGDGAMRAEIGSCRGPNSFL